MRRFGFCFMLTAVLVGSLASSATAISLNPTNDAMLYQFPFAGPGTPPMKSLYPTTLASGFTGTGHDLASVVNFDTASTGLTAAQVSSATLNLFVIPGSTLPPPALGADADATHQIQIDVFKLAVSPAWNENTVKWSTAPLASGGAIDSAAIAGVGQWISLDVTSLVVDWLTTPANNNGLLLSQPGPRVNNGAGSATVALFDSTDGGANELYLEITEAEAVPEPSTLAMGGVAAVACVLCAGWQRHRRNVARRT